jgi:two-component system cell cycle sensor histidine kinase/response regulator CckA
MQNEKPEIIDKRLEGRILIVDDEEDLVLVLADTLESRGYQVEVAHSAQSAREKADSFDAQVALLDVRLGRDSGTDLIAELEQVCPGIICVMMTAYAGVDSAVEALHRGAYDYLQKPLDMRYLMATLDRCFEKLRLESEKAAAEEALRESEERYRLIAENVTDVIWVADMDFCFTFVSPSVEHLRGYSAGEAMAQSLPEVLTPASLVRAIKILEEERENIERGKAQPRTVELEFKCKDGSTVQTESTVSVLYDEYENPIGYLGSTRDITERKQAEEALRESEERFRSIFENAVMGLYRTAPDGHILMANPALVHMLGYSSFDELTQLNLEEDGFKPEYPRSAFKQRIESEGQVIGLESAWVKDDGTTLFVRESAKAIRDKAGNTLYYEGTVEDITERKRAEEDIKQRNRELAILNATATVVSQSLNLDEILDAGLDKVMELVHSDVGGIYLADMEQGKASLVVHRGISKRFARQVESVSVNEKSWTAAAAEGKLRKFILSIEAILRDRVELKRILSAMKKEGLSLASGVPVLLHAKEEILGLMIVARRVTQRYSEAELQLLTSIGQQIALAIQNAQLYQAAQQELIERKRAEDQLRESEERYRNIVELAPEGILTMNLKGVITTCNTAFLRLTGFSRDEIVGKHFSKLPTLHPQKISQYVDMVNSLIRRKAPVPFSEFLWAHKDGTTRWGEAHVGLLKKGSRITGFQGILLDITERKRAEEERERLLIRNQEQARRMQQIMNSVPEGVLLLDSDGRVVLANPIAKRDLTVLADAKVGDLLTGLGDRPLAKVLTSPPTMGLWHEVKAAARTYEIIARPMEDRSESEGWVLVIRDVTQEREVQKRVQQQERLAAVGQLAAGIAHDFNNIMAVIVLYTQMGLGMSDLPPKLRERLKTISQQAKRATDLIQQILDFGRRAVLERRPMDLVPFLKEQVRLLERTLPESIKIDLSYGRDEYIVNADPTRMQQAVMNLAVNARDAMPEGGVLRIALSKTAATDEIRCKTCGQTIQGEWVCIAATDTGSGIPLDVLPHIFEPFFTTKAPGEGAGLGLAQVYGIVKQHEGHVEVSTKMEQGTTFSIGLPALAVPQPTVPTVETQISTKGQGEAVLVVEDDANMREALADTLELLNYQVLIAANGQDALDILAKHGHKIALVLSDLVMPVMGGKALFHVLKQQYPKVKMIMLTGHPMEKELKGLRAQGLSGYLLKPPSIEQLAQVVTQVLKEESE